jgi:two-component system C4-dicarboxylate transport response regulator DctD
MMSLQTTGSGLKENLLLVDSENQLGYLNETIPTSCGIRLRVMSQANTVLGKISPDWEGCVGVDTGIRATGSLHLLRRIKQIDPDIPVVMILNEQDISLVVKAMRMGAYDVLQKPFSDQDLQKIFLGALEKRRAILENRKLQEETTANDGDEVFVPGRSGRMACLSESIRKASSVDTAVLLFGEAGTGKKMIARRLHDNSPGRHRKFVAVNCSFIAEDVLEKELFGSETFTGGVRVSTGKLASARGGTLYLDKIDCLPLSLQDRLLDILQEEKIAKNFYSEPASIDLRVIASTKEDLKNACAEGKFREDLYYRLNVIQIDLPRLQHRLEDLPELFQHFARLAGKMYHRPVPQMPRELLQKLLAKDWPGNVRQLKHTAERFALGFGLDLHDPMTPEESVAPVEQNFAGKKKLAEKVSAFEKNLIAQELKRTNGSVKKTYTALGVPRKTFYDKMHKYGLKRKDFQPPQKLSANDTALTQT